MSHTIANRLRTAVEQHAPLLMQLPLSKVKSRPAPDKWAPIEILGHLIDSAANNHQRFIRGPQQDNLIFQGYAQEKWVLQQNYIAADWKETVSFWRSYNLHLARVMEQIPLAVSTKEGLPHNLKEITTSRVPEGFKVTLAYFMNDYVDHLLHHLKQLLPDNFEDS